MDFSRNHISWRRPLTSYHKVQRVVGHLLRGRRFQLRALRNDTYLNVGSGPNLLAHYINVDYLWTPGLELCWDITRGLPFPPESFAGIYTEHCLEHLTKGTTAKVLREFRRLLRPGGTVRIVVPDAELYLNLYVRAKRGEDVRFPYENNGCLPIDPVNRIFREHGHRYAYDAEALFALLRSAGFETARRAGFRESRDPVLQVDSPERQCESLYVEAWSSN